MNVSQALVRDIETAGTDTHLCEVARRMRGRGIGFMPILEGDKLVGVITDRDIATRAVSEGKDTDTAAAGDISPWRLSAVSRTTRPSTRES